MAKEAYQTSKYNNCYCCYYYYNYYYYYYYNYYNYYNNFLKWCSEMQKVKKRW